VEAITPKVAELLPSGNYTPHDMALKNPETLQFLSSFFYMILTVNNEHVSKPHQLCSKDGICSL
jgi:hypothetical protein